MEKGEKTWKKLRKKLLWKKIYMGTRIFGKFRGNKSNKGSLAGLPVSDRSENPINRKSVKFYIDIICIQKKYQKVFYHREKYFQKYFQKKSDFSGENILRFFSIEMSFKIDFSKIDFK